MGAQFARSAASAMEESAKRGPEVGKLTFATMTFTGDTRLANVKAVDDITRCSDLQT